MFLPEELHHSSRKKGELNSTWLLLHCSSGHQLSGRAKIQPLGALLLHTLVCAICCIDLKNLFPHRPILAEDLGMIEWDICKNKTKHSSIWWKIIWL